LKLWILVLIELAYALLTRVVLPPYFPSEIGREAVTTLARLATIPIYWFLFRDVIGKVTSDGKTVWQKSFWVGVGMFLLVPVVVPLHPMLFRSESALLFASTSFVVGFREELVYRGVLQNLLDRKWGLGMALVVSNVMFVVYHVGAVPITPMSIVELFVGGCLLGVIYAGSRSLVAASLVHGAYDAIASFAPYMENPWPGLTLIILEGAALVVLSRWMWKNAKLEW
jgi:membrane protease YdiL (CAAX protease family)